MAHVEVDLQDCVGCRTCEQVCAFAHEGVFGPARARIQVLRRDVLALEIRVCTHCDEARCVDACPTAALAREGDKTVFDWELCTGCGLCVQVCDLLFWDEERQRPLICDLCGECVRRCPEDAIQIVTT
ncbi:MAG: 4Fe-4S binding protein [Chloroflexota bacterium]|nr:4Fe-4S binding protein [Chloroflexota bacterium]